jgi:hypothetical protein
MCVTFTASQGEGAEQHDHDCRELCSKLHNSEAIPSHR